MVLQGGWRLIYISIHKVLDLPLLYIFTNAVLPNFKNFFKPDECEMASHLHFPDY